MTESRMADFSGPTPKVDALRPHVGRSVSAPISAVVTLALIAVVVSRRPDTVLHPQFWAEDGTFWFAAAYNDGPLVTLQTPAGGYFQSFSRLTAALSLLFGLRWAPLTFGLAAILVQILAPLYLLSSRLAVSIPDLRLRALLALLILGVPNSFEVQSNVTNAQTHLAVLGFLIVVADEAEGWPARIFDVLGLVLAGLSGPTCLMLVPVAAIAYLRERRSGRRKLILVVTTALALAQGAAIVTTGPATRVATPLGASVLRLLALIGGQIFVAGTLGAKIYATVFSILGEASITASTIGFAGLVFIGRIFVLTTSFQLRMALLFGTLVLSAALISPVVGSPPRWRTLQMPNVGVRYYVIPIAAYLAALLWASCADPCPALRRVSRVGLLAVLLVGMPLDWRVDPRPDLGFEKHVAAFEAAPAGSLVRIPIPPAGWEMHLRKR